MLTNHLSTWWRMLVRRRCRPTSRRTPRVWQLEDRTLLSSGLGGWNALAPLPTLANGRTELVFIDSRVPDASRLATSVLPGAEIHLLNANQGGLEQISQALAGRHETADLHILSHGMAGTLELGNSLLTAANLGQHATALHTIAAALASDSDLLLYACDAAQGAAGQALIHSLASDTSATVAASVDATGAASLGANWTLESTTGTIHARAAFEPSTLTSYNQLLGAPDPSQCVVDLSLGTVQAGSTVVVTLQAVDASGVPLSTGGDNVTFGLASASASRGTFSAVTDHLDGTYTSIFTGTTNAGLVNTITATIDGQAVTSTLPTITVTPGPADPATTQVALLDNIIQAGDGTGVDLRAKDAYGNLLTTGGDTITFSVDTASGTSRGTLGAVVDQGNGTYSARLTGTIAGSPSTISATLDGQSVTSALPAFTVIPGPADAAHSTITVVSSPVVAGTAVTLTVKAADQFGNPATTGGNTVLLSIDATNSTGTGVLTPVTDNGDGTYTATFRGHLVGTVSITATLDGTSLPDGIGLPAGDAAAVTVTPGPVDLGMSCVTVAPTGSVAADGSSLLTVTLTALDAFGNANPTGVTDVGLGLDTASGTSTGVFGNGVTGSDVFGIAACPMVVSLNQGAGSDQGGGIWTDTFQGIVAGTATNVRATINGQQVTCTPPTVTVTPGPFDPTKAFLTIQADTQTPRNNPTVLSGNNANSLPAGNALLITLTALDQFCNANPTGITSVVFSQDTASGTSTGVFGNDVAGSDVFGIAMCPTIVSLNQGMGSNQGGGVWTDTFQGIVVGTPTNLVGSINGQAVSAGTVPSAQVTAGAFDPGMSQVTIQATTRAANNDATQIAANQKDALKLPAGNALLITLTAEDAYCNANPTGITGVVFSLDTASGTSTGVFGNDVPGSDVFGIARLPTTVSFNQGTGTDQGGGVWTDSFEGIVAGSKTNMAVTILGSGGNLQVTSTPATAVVTPGAVDAGLSLQSTSKDVRQRGQFTTGPNAQNVSTVAVISATHQAQMTFLTVLPEDSFGNLHPTNIQSVQFVWDNGQGRTSLFAHGIAMPGNPDGTYVPSLDFYSQAAPLTYTITVAVNGTTLPTNTNVTVHAVPGQAYQYVATSNLQNFRVGQATTVTLVPEDFFNNITTSLAPQTSIVFYGSGGSSVTIVGFAGCSSREAVSRGGAAPRLNGARVVMIAGQPTFQITITPLTVGSLPFFGLPFDVPIQDVLGKLTLKQITKTQFSKATNGQAVVSTTLFGQLPLTTSIAGHVQSVPVYGVSVAPPSSAIGGTGTGQHRHG